MQLVKRVPLRELRAMDRDLERLWEDDWGELPTIADNSTVDVYEENTNLIAKTNLPNFRKPDIKVKIDGKTLEIIAEHKEQEEDKTQRRYFFRETSNRDVRRVSLPEAIRADDVVANFKNGTLKVTMPKLTAKLVKAVEIK